MAVAGLPGAGVRSLNINLLGARNESRQVDGTGQD